MCYHEELRQTIEAWRPYLIGDDTSVDTLKLHSFHFDFSKVIATSIYIDLGRLLHAHALKDDNIHSTHNSENTKRGSRQATSSILDDKYSQVLDQQLHGNIAYRDY